MYLHKLDNTWDVDIVDNSRKTDYWLKLYKSPKYKLDDEKLHR